MRISNLIICVVLSLALLSCNERTIQKETEPADTTIDTTDTYIMSKVDSIKFKSKVTKEDIEYVFSNPSCDRDYAWCRAKETELIYDSLDLMRKEIAEKPQNQQYVKIFDKDWALFAEYKESALEALLLDCDACGTGCSLCYSDMSFACCRQYEAANKCALECLCGGKPKQDKHITISQRMIDDAYSQYIKTQTDKQKQDSIREEQRKWNNWISYRNSNIKNLPDNVRKYFENGTNNAMRAKLIQLKNQYQDYGVVSMDIINCLLSNDCTDEELVEYPSFEHVWDIYCKHSSDTEWTDWKRYRVYDMDAKRY